jgi:hypothetical protein
VVVVNLLRTRGECGDCKEDADCAQDLRCRELRTDGPPFTKRFCTAPTARTCTGPKGW